MLEKLAAKFGACPIQYKHLLQTEKLIQERGLEGKQGLAKLSLTLTCVFCFLMSIFAALPVYYKIDVFPFALIGVTISMSMIGFWTLPYFDLLLSPINYPVVAHTPVSSRTYFLVKLTQILKYAFYLLFSLNTFPSFCGIFIRSEEASVLCYFFPLFYLPIVFMSGFFTIGLMTAFAGYLTRLHSIKPLRKIAKSAQFILPLLFPISFYLIPFELVKDNIDFIEKLVSVLPIGWFAGAISLVANTLNRPDVTRDLILTGVAFISTLLLIVIPLRSIAKTYSKYLSFLLESGGREKVILKMRIPLLARFFKSRHVYAGFCLSAVYLRRDRQILHRMASGIVVSAMMIILMFVRKIYPVEWLEYHYAIGLSPVFTGIFVFFGVTFVLSYLGCIGFTEHYKASWMLSIAPLRKPHELWRGVENTAFFCLILPFTFLMFILSAYLWGVTGILFVLPGLLVVLLSVITYPIPESGIPLSQEPVEIDGMSGCLAYGISMLIAGALVGVQFLARLIHLWVYIGVYTIIVVGGFIILVHYHRKRHESVLKLNG